TAACEAMNPKEPNLQIIQGERTGNARRAQFATPRPSCSAFLGCSRQKARNETRELLDHIPGYGQRPRVGSHHVTDLQGAFVRGAVVTWSPASGRRCIEVGAQIATDDPDDDEMVTKFLELIRHRLPEAVLVQWHLED